jgi:GTPase
MSDGTKTPVVAIVGRPNVGKSTLFNRLTGERTAVESEERGTTRDRLYGLARWRGRSFILVDTAGFVADSEDAPLREQVEIALAEADKIVLVVDLAAGLLPEDTEVARRLRRLQVPTIVVGNKADQGKTRENGAELLRLGFGEPISVSAIHGRGSGELLDVLVQDIPPAPVETAEESIKAALIGRPNVGKSSLLNWLAPTRRALTSPEPGTTRDSLSAKIAFDGRTIELLDTAGVRRRGKIVPGVERWSTIRSLRGLTTSEIALLVIDASEGITAGDAHLAGLAHEQGKGLVIVVNKWDLADEEQEAFLRRLRRAFSFAPYAPVLFMSATEGGDPSLLLQTILGIDAERRRRIETPRLNSFLEEATNRKPPAGLGRQRPQLKYATQVAVNPPTFTFFGRNLRRLHFSYKRYLENRLREAFGFHGTGLILQFKESKDEKTHRRTR